MSSTEKVIGEVVVDMKWHVEARTFLCKSDNTGLIEGWIDRLSTPAAEQDGDALCAQLRRENWDDAADTIEQLQARNAELLHEAEEARRNGGRFVLRAEAAESEAERLRAGIEGLANECAYTAEEDTGMLGALLQSLSERLKALREGK